MYTRVRDSIARINRNLMDLESRKSKLDNDRLKKKRAFLIAKLPIVFEIGLDDAYIP